MSAFDARVRVGSAGVGVIKENDDTPAYEAELALNLMGIAPVGPGQAIPIPFGTIRVPLDTGSVDALIQQLQEAREQMAERPPQVETATNLSEADRLAKITQGLHG